MYFQRTYQVNNFSSLVDSVEIIKINIQAWIFIIFNKPLLMIDDKFLQSLGINNWSVKEIWKSGGQGITAKVYNQKTNDWGVFKYPKDAIKTDLKRCKREIEILREIDNNNKSIVSMLASSEKDEQVPWLITELGKPFTTYWNNFRESEKDFDRQISKALEIIIHLCDGLAELHERDDALIHRDIKPDNIVVVGDTPKLIDFGVAFWSGKERLTNVEDAVGNRRFSPDVMMYRQEEVNPWLDVFMLSQVFMWMLADGPVKKWDRPWDYRFVRYPDNAAPWLNKILAITGLCSDEMLAPKNARELKSLIDKIFHSKISIVEGDLSKIVNVAKMMSDLKTQEFSASSVLSADLNRKLDATKFIVLELVRSIGDSVKKIVDQLQEKGVNVQIVRRNDNAVLELAEKFKRHPLNGTRWGQEVFSLNISSFEGHLNSVGLVVTIDVRQINTLANPYILEIRNAINEYHQCYVDEQGRCFKDIKMEQQVEEKDIVGWFVHWLESPSNWR